ncbi:MAG: beta-N-acetylhexosaminidase, partial [Flavobacteriia bacterium]|nr:beta-N-acetylhexosaminidase [Flavobacteriia bacterium]
GKDLVAEIQFKRAMTIQKLGVSFLRDVNSWIFDPAEVRIEVSKDGKVYTEAINRKFNPISVDAAEKEGKKITNFEQTVNFLDIKYVKVLVKNPGTCPAWHLGAGNPSWLFLDEIIIE